MKKKILVIDDDRAIRKSFEITFEDSEIMVETVESGRAGLEKLMNSFYNLVFLDLKMPEMNGVETLKRIRAFNTTVTIYIISAFYKEFLNELKDAARNGLNFEVLQKPIDGKTLSELVHAII